jgi:hypothetical protein
VKITKRQLRRIIKEEKQKLLQESPQDDLRMLTIVIKNLTEMAMGYDVDEEMKSELLSQVELLNGVYSSMYSKTTSSPAQRRDEAKGFTKKYDDDSALTGGQSKLPDGLQKSIIDKSVDDRKEDKEEKNEGTKLGNMPDSWRQILGTCLGEE